MTAPSKHGPVTLVVIMLLLSGYATLRPLTIAASNLRIGETEQPKIIQTLSSSCITEKQEGAIVQAHATSASDLARLREKTRSWQQGTDYNLRVDGHGTGLAPPDESGWTSMAENAFVAEKVSLQALASPPERIDHSTEPWFPPIGNQGSKGSCVAWAVAYYVKTFQEALEHNWNVSAATWEGGYYGHPSVGYQDKIFSPDFVYNLINNGVDQGSSYCDAINLVCSIGAASWAKMPYNPEDPSSWPLEEAWKEAPYYRGNASGYQQMFLDTDDDLQSLKNWLASSHLAIISVDAHKYVNLTSQDVWTLDNYVSPAENHASTVVGYDDNLTYAEQGEIRHGAFKIANSWGKGGWERTADGCFWISYEAMKQRVGQFMFYFDIVDYKPQLACSFRIEHAKRGECSITVGIGDNNSSIITKRFDQYVSGGSFPFCANDVTLDVTEFKKALPVLNNQSFFLRIRDTASSTTGTLFMFAVNDAESDDPPIETINNANIYAYVTLTSTCPTIRILSPENKTYAVDDCPLSFILNENVSLIQYSLDDQENRTITGNTTLTDLTQGIHSVSVYASDSYGNVGKSEAIHFGIDTTPPYITNVTEPLESMPLGTLLGVNATVADSNSGIRQVLLNCTFANDTSSWNCTAEMTYLTGCVWNGTIPTPISVTNMTYEVIAEDNAGNRATSQCFTCVYQAPVAHEYSSIIILPLLLGATLLLTTIRKKGKKD